MDRSHCCTYEATDRKEGMPGMVKQENRIIRNTFYAQLAAFVVSSLATSIGAMVDGVVIGQCLGVDSMAAFGVVTPLLIVFSLAGTMVSSGARNRFTRFVGEGKLEEAQGVFSMSCVLSVGFATALMLVMLMFASPIAAFLGATGNAASLLPKARNYLIGIAVGLPAMNAMRILTAYMPLDNDRNLPVIASIVLTAVDIVLDLLVAFVLHGDTLEMGLATSLGYYCAAATLLTHFHKKNIILRFTVHHLPWQEAGRILRQGLPVGFCRLGNTLRSTFMNRLLAMLATSAAIAAYSVHRQADSFLNPVTIGMADTVAMLAGVLLGEEDRPMMKRLLLTSAQATMLLTLGVSALAWIIAPQFAGMYIKNDPEALRLSVRAVRCYAVGMPLYGLNLIYFNYFQGIGKSLLSSVSGFLSEAGFLMLSAWSLSHWLGADSVWVAFPVTQMLMLLYYAVVIAVEDRRLDIRHKSLWDRILLLPNSFDVPEDARMDWSITTMEEVTELSREVWSFCERHGCDPRRRYLMSLSVEEMVGNVIQHGFSGDKRKHSVDVRILKKGEDYIVRIRDDCFYFDPLKGLQLYSPEDPAHHMGLSMIIKTAKSVQYTCILKLNNLVIRT